MNQDAIDIVARVCSSQGSGSRQLPDQGPLRADDLLIHITGELPSPLFGRVV